MKALHIPTVALLLACSASLFLTASTYALSPYPARGACDAGSIPGPVQTPGHLIIGPAPWNLIYIKDASGNMPYRPLTFHTIVFHDDDVWNNHPEPRQAPVTLSIIDQESGRQVFNQTQAVGLPACGGPGKVLQWTFVPVQISNYVATVTDYKYKVSMGFHTVSDSTLSAFPPPLEQARLGVRPDSVNCSNGLWLLIKAEDGSPACVGPGTAKELIERGWARQGTYYRDMHVQPEITLNDYSYQGIGQDSNTTVSFNNQTYYQTTLNYSAYRLPPATPIQFHNVTFTFPAGTFLTPGGAIVMLEMRFQDGYAETYGSHTANGGSGILVPAKYGPHLAVNSTTVLSNHMMPQAGITIYHDRVRLLVSADNLDLSKSQISGTERIRIIPEYPITTGINRNGTITDSETIEILFDNFKQNVPLVVRILDPQGGIYKADNIPPSHIQPDGFYKYQIYIKGNASEIGRYTVSITHGNATASMYTYLSNAVP